VSEASEAEAEWAENVKILMKAFAPYTSLGLPPVQTKMREILERKAREEEEEGEEEEGEEEVEATIPVAASDSQEAKDIAAHVFSFITDKGQPVKVLLKKVLVSRPTITKKEVNQVLYRNLALLNCLPSKSDGSGPPLWSKKPSISKRK